MGDYPGTLGSVIVTVNKQTKKLTTDYTINVKNKTIRFEFSNCTNHSDVVLHVHDWQRR